MARFTLPRDVYHGKGALENLKALKGKKAVIVVGGGSMKRFGFLDKAENYLKEAGFEVMIIDGVEPDPSVTTVMNGAANAMYLPKVIAFNAKDPTAKKRYGVIADYMHLEGSNDDEKIASLIKYLRGMNDQLKIPHCIKNYGADSYPCEQGFVPENVFLERVHDIAVNAIADACTGSNPRQPSPEEMEKLLKCCYYDTDVDF